MKQTILQTKTDSSLSFLFLPFSTTHPTEPFDASKGQKAVLNRDNTAAQLLLIQIRAKD